jgi:hypothetical protein
MATKGIGEVIAETAKITSVEDRVKNLQENSSAALKMVLGYCYDPNIIWLLPETNPPFKPLEKAHDVQGRMFSEAQKLHYYVENQGRKDKVPQHRREQMFIQLLESVDPDDAELLLNIKTKKMPSKWKGVSKNVVKKAFPGISAHWS